MSTQMTSQNGSRAPRSEGNEFRTLRKLFCALAAAMMVWSDAAAAVEPLPAIVTYELKKQRREERAQERNPKAFWFRQISARIENRMSAGSKTLKNPARLQIEFVVARDGHLVSSKIDKTSGSPAVDETALKLLAASQPFPPIPAAVTDDSVTFSIPIRFR